MASWRGWTVGALLGAVSGCAHVRPSEPVISQQLWKQEGCVAHILPEWRHVVLQELAGTVMTGGMARPEPVPEARVFARVWPNGRLFTARTDANGVFVFPQAAEGMYEVAVCREGFNPWRGTVKVRQSAHDRRGTFAVELGV